jgi:hypothetical protein
VGYNDILELSYDGDPNAPNWSSGRYDVRGVTTTALKINRDAGDTYGQGQGSGIIDYNVYEPGTANWVSEALVDVFLPDGTLDTTIDLNQLARPDGLLMANAMVSAQGGSPPASIGGFLALGDIEIAPDGAYYDTGQAIDERPASNVTRLWVAGYGGGDNSPDNDDGLDLLVVDVEVYADGENVGKVSDARYFGGIDDGELMSGDWYEGNFNVTGFEPVSMWRMFNDIGFDGLGNLVYIGGRGGNDNRYSAVDAPNVALSVANMVQEQGLSEDAVVGTIGFFLDMNYFGFNTDMGIAFDNVLENYGSAVSPVTLNELVSSSPAMDQTLPCKINNEIELVFSGPVPGGATATIVTCGGADVSANFTFTVAGNTLYCKETTAVTDITWYSVSENASTGSLPFQVDMCKLIGDADNSGQVLAFDYFEVKNNIFYSPVHMSDNCAATPPQTINCGRADMDGSGQVLAFDYFEVKNHMFNAKPAKPVCP